MSTRLLHARAPATARSAAPGHGHGASSGAVHAPQQLASSPLSRVAEAELLRGVALVRADAKEWDRASKAARRRMLQRFLWLHQPEGAGIGAQQGPPKLHTPDAKSASSAEHKESPPAGGVSVLASASLESLYGAGASLLLLRVSAWLRLTYTLPASSGAATLLCLAAIRCFVQDTQGGARFVHEFVEAGGMRTLLAILELPLPGAGVDADADTALAAAVAKDSPDASTSPEMGARGLQHRPVHERHSHPHYSHAHGNPAAPSRAALAAHAAHSKALRESEQEKFLCLCILRRISATGRSFKELLCEAQGVRVVLACLASVREEEGECSRTAEVAKQLLCQLGQGNPRYASLVHEELLTSFRSGGSAASASHACKRMVLQTMHVLLSNAGSSRENRSEESGGGGGGGEGGASFHGGEQQFDAHGFPLLPSPSDGDVFLADARYVDATVSLFHLSGDVVSLHFEAFALLKLLITKHQLQEAVLQALVAILRQKSVRTSGGGATNAAAQTAGAQVAGAASSRAARHEQHNQSHHQPQSQQAYDEAAAAAAGASGGNRSRRPSRDASSILGQEGFASPRGLGSSSGVLHSGVVGGGGAHKASDPKSCAVKLLNELALSSYELCLRMTQLGVITLLLDALCPLPHQGHQGSGSSGGSGSSMELQTCAAMLLYTLHNNVQESASLIRIMLSTGATTSSSATAAGLAALSSAAASSSSAAPDALYRLFLQAPEQLHRQLGPLDAAKIQANLHNPALASTFLSQRRSERRAQAAGERSRRGSAVSAAAAAAAAAAASLNPARTSGGSQSAANSRHNSGNFSASLAEALQSGNKAAASAVASSTVRPQLAPDHPSLLRAGSISVAAGGVPLTAPSTPLVTALSGAFLQARNLEEEDAAFFARGLASVARPDPVADQEAAAAAAATAAARKDEAKLDSPERARPTEALSVTVDKELARDGVVAALKGGLGAKGPGPGFAAKRRAAAAAAGGAAAAPVAPHADAIHVPILSLHFDPKLKLASEGAPSDTSSAAAAAAGALSHGALSAAAIKRAHGVHEAADAADEAYALGAAAGAVTAPAPFYAPFATPIQTAEAAAASQAAAAAVAAAAVPRAPAGANPAAVAAAAAAAAAASSASHASTALVFSQRVGLSGPGVGGVSHHDPVSDAYLRLHFKDLMHEQKAAFLTHGASVAEKAAAGAAAAATSMTAAENAKARSREVVGGGSSVAATEVEGEEGALLLDSVIPHVEVLDGHQDAAAATAAAAGAGGAAQDAKSAKQHAEDKQASLKARRDEKRSRDAEAAAVAATKFNQKKKGGGGGGGTLLGPGETYEGFTADLVPKQKSADEFSDRRIDAAAAGAAAIKATLADAKKAHSEAAAAIAEHAAGGGGGGGTALFARPLVRDESSSASSVPQQPSNRSILQMAIQLDHTGRTIDPRRWIAAARVRDANKAATSSSSAAASAPGTEAATTPTSVSPTAAAPAAAVLLPAFPGETESQRAERVQLESELAALRLGASGRPLASPLSLSLRLDAAPAASAVAEAVANATTVVSPRSGQPKLHKQASTSRRATALAGASIVGTPAAPASASASASSSASGGAAVLSPRAHHQRGVSLGGSLSPKSTGAATPSFAAAFGGGAAATAAAAAAAAAAASSAEALGAETGAEASSSKPLLSARSKSRDNAAASRAAVAAALAGPSEGEAQSQQQLQPVSQPPAVASAHKDALAPSAAPTAPGGKPTGRKPTVMVSAAGGTSANSSSSGPASARPPRTRPAVAALGPSVPVVTAASAPPTPAVHAADVGATAAAAAGRVTARQQVSAARKIAAQDFTDDAGADD